jgi:Zn-dependent protease with chaperone function
MDFFTAQDQARNHTGLLVVLFVLAVVSLVCMTDLLIVLLYGLKSSHHEGLALIDRVNWGLVFWASIGVVMVVIGGTWYKMNALSGGGDAVAQMMGGEPVFADDDDLSHKRLVNVVEEMALASGIPMPQVYVLPESGINAFAAGLTTSDAVVAVTQGALDQFNREQLQGVIAHEFSHILNGDMRLNIRLIGILHGILVIGLIGRALLSGRRHSSSNDKGGGAFLGLGFLIIGYAGVFFGNLIKAAVSRQREFLADASAVQFTRNPDGIGGALMVIGAGTQGSLLRHRRSGEVSHALFSQGVRNSLSSPFATHPPLADRIRKILPSWDGKFPQAGVSGKVMGRASTAVASGSTASIKGQAGVAGSAAFVGAGENGVAPGALHMQEGRRLLQQIPSVVREAAHDPFAARALVVLLVLDKDEAARERQLAILGQQGDPGVDGETRRLLQKNGLVPRKLQLPMLELVLPTLRRITEHQAKSFLEVLDAVIQEDHKVTLFEWCLQRIVIAHLHEVFGWSDADRAATDATTVAACVGTLLSLLTYAASTDPQDQETLFTRAAQDMCMPQLVLSTRRALSLSQLDTALPTLRQLPPRKKQRLFAACLDIVMADGEVTTVEGELLRVVAATLAIPVPPLS